MKRALACIFIVYCFKLSESRRLQQVSTSTTDPSVLDMEAQQLGTGWDHACALKSNGELFCWGGNANGQLGVGFTTVSKSSRPLLVAKGSLWKMVSPGGWYTCGIKVDDTLWCWGNLTTGYGTSGFPALIADGEKFESVSCGSFHCCAIKISDSLAYCWGENTDGQLGDGTKTYRPTPTPVYGNQAFSQVECGRYHTLAILKEDHTAVGFGSNTVGQLGDGTRLNSTVPVRVAGGKQWKKVTAGNFHSCGISVDGAGWCWGYNADGRLGTGELGVDKFEPTAVKSNSSWLTLDAGAFTTCGIQADGNAAYCFGDNYYGQIGDGTTDNRAEPSMVSGAGVKWRQIATSIGTAQFSCGIQVDGVLQCWGNSLNGRLGSPGTSTNLPRAVDDRGPWGLGLSAPPTPSSISTGIIVGIAAGSAVALLALGAILYCCCLRSKNDDCIKPTGEEETTNSGSQSLSPLSSQASSMMTVNLGDIDVKEPLGDGSFGEVRKGVWQETLVAVKILRSREYLSTLNSSSHERLINALEQEAALMAKLSHPNIVQFMCICLDPPAIVLEYCQGGSLTKVLREAKTNPEKSMEMTWPKRLRMLLEAATGMLYLHSRNPSVVHRDLKSPNLLVTTHGTVKVADFNLSRELREQNEYLSSISDSLNPLWLAPEATPIGGSQFTTASDVFAFAIVMWEMLTWMLPWSHIIQQRKDAYAWVVMSELQKGERPPVPPKAELPGPAASDEVLEGYLSLMQRCWEQEPEARPRFVEVAAELRVLLEKAEQ